jgi:hypothetical protein
MGQNGMPYSNGAISKKNSDDSPFTPSKNPRVLLTFFPLVFQMRDPYSVLVARNWARDMAGLEGLLCLGVLFFFACVTFFGGTTSGDDPLVADDDDFTVAGVALTGHVALRGSSADGGSGDDESRSLAWADFAVAPFAAKGLLLLLEVSAVGCACAGACLASCCHFKCGSLREVDLLAALGWCSGCSALATAASLAFTAVCLLYKWERALGASEIRGALLVMSM